MNFTTYAFTTYCIIAQDNPQKTRATEKPLWDKVVTLLYQCHQSILWSLHRCPGVITITRGGSAGTLTSLQ